MKTQTIPNKLYFRIGEVADLLSVKPYVLRYWETEFPDIKPAKSKSGQRLYKRRDVELLVKIKELLYQERFTINGARKRLKEVLRERRGYEGVSQIPLLPREEVSRKGVASANSGNHPKSEQRQAANPVRYRSRLSETRMSEDEENPQPTQSPLDNHKILLKIKKDLESLLDALKA